MIDPAHPDFTSTPAADDRPTFDYRPAGGGEEPSLSIVTTFFDTDPAIFAETARCIERQSLQQWEWVIVDDGSTRPESRELLARYAEDARIRIVRHDQNQSVPAARNTGIANARSEFILQVDSDDLLEPTAAEKWLWLLTSYPEYSFVNAFQVGFGNTEYLWPRGFHEGEEFLTRNLTNPSGVARQELFRIVGGFDSTLAGDLEDWEFWLRSAAAGRWGATLPEYLVWYRRKSGEGERWSNWDEGPRQNQLLQAWRQRYAPLWEGKFPRIEPSPTPESEIELEALPFENPLAKDGKHHLLMIVPWAFAGGADKFNIDLVGQLARRGWKTTVATTFQGDHSWLPRFTRLTPDVFAASHFLKPADYPRFLRYLIRSRRPDLIFISGSEFAYDALAYLRRVADRTPIVDYCHVVEEYWLGGGHPRLSADNREFLDLHITASAHVQDWLARRGVDRERIEVCRINIEPRNGVRPPRAELGLPEDVPIIAYPCRLVFQKQPHVFAKTVRELNRRGYRFLAVAAGDGPYFAWLESFVARHSLQHCVRLLGRQPADRLRDLTAAADCVFLPSASEGIAVVLYEAMADGVAVVAADVGGQRELVTPECGVLVERADEETEVLRYTEALAQLLDEPGRRRAMGEAGRARIRAHFTLDMMGERMSGLFKRARELASTTPRPLPSAQDAHDAALEAIRHVPWGSPDAPGVDLLPPEPERVAGESAASGPRQVIDLVLATVERTEEPRRFLEALEAQSYPYFRLIVVDQNTDDRLSGVFAGFKPFPILHLRSEPGNSRARNIGLRHVDADIVAFPDDDCWYPPDLLQQVVEQLAAHPEWDGLSGRSVDEDGHPSGGLWNRTPGAINRFNIWKRVSAYTVFLRSAASEQVGRFDETLGLGPGARWPAGEDLDFVLRSVQAGSVVYYDPSLRIHHRRTRERSAQPVANEGYRYGTGVGRVLRKNRLPWWFAYYQFARSFGAAALNRLRRQHERAEFYLAVGRGRVRGWRSAGIR